MRLFSDTQASVSKLFDETGEYARLCKQYAQRKLADGVTDILSTAIMAFALIVVGGIGLLLLLLALAYLLGNVLDNLPLGFVCAAVVALLLALAVYWCRKRWIVANVARRVDNVICAIEANTPHLTTDELERRMNDKRELALAHLHTLTSSARESTSRAQKMSRMVYRVMSLYNGFRLGMSVMGVLGGRKRKKT